MPLLRHLSRVALVGLALSLPALAATPSPTHVLSIGRMPQPPALDGQLADWPSDATVLLLGQAADRLRRPGNWGGPQDLCGAIRLAWDTNALYVAADVCDDRPTQAETPTEIWQGDSLELFFSLHPQQQQTNAFWQIALVPPLRPEVRLRTVGPQKEFEGVEGACQVRTNGYTLEGRIPWHNLTGFTPEPGASLGFQLYLDDRDGNGRRAQLAWYPSAITFSRPTETGTLILRPTGDTATPRVRASAATECVTDPRRLRLGLVTDTTGTRATITPLTLTNATLTMDLQAAGEGLRIGQADLPIEGLDGRLAFTVTVQATDGRPVAVNEGEVMLAGLPYARMKALQDTIAKRLEDLPAPPDEAGTLARAGLMAWSDRHRALVNNEARPECLTRPLLDRMLGELDALDHALSEFEAGRDPYARQTGSLVRAYRSPLTGQPRPCALFVPPSYTPDGTNAYPLIVLLHGIFADERQLALLADTFRDLDAIVCQAPAYRQFDWSGVSAAETWAGLDEIQRHYRIDADRVVLAGHHIGGRGVWQLAMARPDRWAAAAPLFSGIDTRPDYPALRLYPDTYDQAVAVQIPPPQFHLPPRPEPIASALERDLFTQASLVPRLENVRALPLRSAFGEDDPDAAAERIAMERRLAELGAPLATHYVPGAMHGSMAAEIEDPAFYRGLLAHRRPPLPHAVTFTTPGLRDNAAWWVRIDGQDSPARAARVQATSAADRVTVQTTNITGLTLVPDTRLAGAGTELRVVIDGSPAGILRPAAPSAPVSFVRGTNGQWSVGTLPAGTKRHGLSGPINDFQFDRFCFVYGTGGDTNEQARSAALGKRLSNWGLGAVFLCKADREINDDDLHTMHLILLGTPRNNTLLARMEAQLPLRWTEGGVQLGTVTAQGPDAGACVIVPNPLAPERYAVIVTATSEAGYQVWNQRAPGGDYVLGIADATAKPPAFTVTARGWFDSRWQWDPTLGVVKGAGTP